MAERYRCLVLPFLDVRKKPSDVLPGENPVFEAQTVKHAEVIKPEGFDHFVFHVIRDLDHWGSFVGDLSHST